MGRIIKGDNADFIGGQQHFGGPGRGLLGHLQPRDAVAALRHRARFIQGQHQGKGRDIHCGLYVYGNRQHIFQTASPVAAQGVALAAAKNRQPAAQGAHRVLKGGKLIIA